MLMAKNTDNNTRRGAVKDRSQVLNPKTKMYVKRDKTTGKFISAKATPYKGVRKENKKTN
jgi:hypothetical protein